uniref:Integrase catalytic domain-containing protein n=1 Tax=Fagus sylvatica TaxID=28930 RepID=A0A2N9GAH5_FAGSY
MNPLKCAFGVSAGKFLGFLVHNRGIDVDPAKASAIATMKAPTSHKELKSFLGRLSYIRRFIPGLAAATAIFMPLMKKGVAFFPGRPLRLYLASNSEAIGGLVAQKDEEGRPKGQSTILAQWLLQLSQYEITTETPTAIKSQAIADLLAQFPGEDSSSISHENMKLISPGLVIAHEMGIKHLRVIGDSNLIICQTKGEFSLKEPSLALYRALAQKLEEKFHTFEISHAMRCENRYADALATLGSQVSFEGSKVDITIDKRSMPITDLLKEKFKEQNLDAEDWRTPIRAKLMSPEGVADLKVLKAVERLCELIAGDLYRRLPESGGQGKMRKPRGSSKETDRSPREKVLRTQRWCKPLPQTPAPGLLLAQHGQAATRLKKLATRYFVEGGILFRKGFHGDPLRCLSLAESQIVMKEAHSGECGEHQGKKRLYQLLLTLGYYWPTMKKDTADFVKSCHTCQLQANLIHTHPTSLQNMATPWPFHTWGLDLIGPINPSSGGCIWILVATEYFTKWVEAIPLRKATGAAVANFIREHIITRFGIPHKIISDNGTPFVNKNVKEVLEHYRIKHRRSTPYYPQGNGQAEATNRMLLRILSKMVFDYGKGWNSHLADTLWAYRGSTKTATGFTPFSLVYGTDAISPTELLVPSPRILHGMDLEADADICAEARVADLEGLEEARELAQARSLRYHQKLADAYEKTLQTRIFAKGQMVLKTVDHVRRGLPSPSKFAPNWEGAILNPRSV